MPVPSACRRAGVPAEDMAPVMVDDWSFAKVIVRVDLTALDRGHVAPGEVCEIAGQGPIPVADAWRMIDGDAFVAAVTTKGTEIDKVVHLGRKPTVLQTTALEWFSAGECSIEGCTNPARIEIDHVADWADTKITPSPTWPHRAGTTTTSRPTTATPSDRDSPTGNDNSSHPTAAGPPGGTDPPGSLEPPGLTLLHGDGPDEPPPPPDTTQGDLFDTG